MKLFDGGTLAAIMLIAFGGLSQATFPPGPLTAMKEAGCFIPTGQGYSTLSLDAGCRQMHDDLFGVNDDPQCLDTEELIGGACVPIDEG